MSLVSKETLKTYFNEGDVPSESEYVNLIDTIFSPSIGIYSYMKLLGLRGFWPFSSISESYVNDISANGRHLTKVGLTFPIDCSPLYTDEIPYASFAVNNYLYRADEAGFDITGTENYIASAYKGLTIGGWIRFDSTPSNYDNGIIGKYAPGQQSYLLYRSTSSNKYTFTVSSTGSDNYNVIASNSYFLNQWTFVVGRFDPSTHVAIFQNGVWSSNISSIPSSLYVSTSRFEIGSFNNGAASTTWNHYGALYFLTCSALSNSTIENLYYLTKDLFISGSGGSI